MPRAERARHAVHRARQTFRTFDHPVRLLAGAAAGKARGTAPDLVFRIGDVGVTAPASEGAIFPIYEVFAEDVYRLGWFTRDLGDGPGVLDIGAHVGSFSLAFLRLHRDARIAAYEASPTTASYLRRSVETSGAAGSVSCHAEAVSTVAGHIDFTDNDTCSPMNGLTARHGHTGQLTRVPSITLATAFARLGRVDLVKIDAEGVEYDLVLTSDPGLWSQVSRAVLEYHQVEGNSRDQLVDFFAATGLREVAHEPMLGNPLEGLSWFAREPFADTGP